MEPGKTEQGVPNQDDTSKTGLGGSYWGFQFITAKILKVHKHEIFGIFLINQNLIKSKQY
jgi:hypothetical protein